MTVVDQAIETQLSNIQKKTGKSLAELYAWLSATGLAKHGELRDAAKSGLGLGHGDANTLALTMGRPLPDLGAATGSAAGALPAVPARPLRRRAPVRRKTRSTPARRRRSARFTTG